MRVQDEKKEKNESTGWKKWEYRKKRMRNKDEKIESTGQNNEKFQTIHYWYIWKTNYIFNITMCILKTKRDKFISMFKLQIAKVL